MQLRQPGCYPQLFAEKAAGGTPSVRFYRVCYDGGLVCTTLYYADGWRCRNTRAAWRDGTPQVTFTADYALTALFLSEKESLIYTCAIPDNTAASKHDGYIEPTTMIRLTPKAPVCAEAEEKFLAGIGYNYNGLFTRTWTAGGLDSVCLNDLISRCGGWSTAIISIISMTPIPKWTARRFPRAGGGV